MGYVRPTFVAAPSTSAILWVLAMSGYPDPNDSPYSPCFFVWRTWSSQSPCVLNSPPVPLDFVWRSFDIYIYFFFFLVLGGIAEGVGPLDFSWYLPSSPGFLLPQKSGPCSTHLDVRGIGGGPVAMRCDTTHTQIMGSVVCSLRDSLKSSEELSWRLEFLKKN